MAGDNELLISLGRRIEGGNYPTPAEIEELCSSLDPGTVAALWFWLEVLKLPDAPAPRWWKAVQ